MVTSKYMNKYTLLFLFLICTLLGHSQKISLEAELGVNETVQIVEEAQMVKSVNQLSFQIGINVPYHLTSRSQIGIGVYLFNPRYRFQDSSITFTCNLFSENSSNSSFYDINQNSFYGGVPLYYQVNLSRGESTIYTKIGINLLVYLYSKGKTSLIECGGNPIELHDSVFYDLNSVLFVPEMGLGYSFRINESLSGFIELHGEYSITKIYEKVPAFLTEDTLNNMNFLNAGISFGVAF